MKLTDRRIATLKPNPTRRVELPDDKVAGLALRVTPNGIKTWTLRYRLTGGRADRRRRLTLGGYPALTLAKARKAANIALGQVATTHTDPATAKRAARLGETFGDLARDYLARHAKRHKRSWREDERILDADLLPAWRTRKVKDISRREVRELVEGIADRGSPIMANRTLALIRKMLNFAITRDWIDANPAARIPKPGAERSRERVLTDDEIRLVWDACEAERPALCALMRLRLVTAQRGGELARLRWIDVESDWLTLPSTATKNKVAHRVFLTSRAQTLVGKVPRIEGCEYIFAGQSGLRPVGDVKKAGRRIAARVLAKLRESDPSADAFDFRGHDLRRTSATRMADAGISQADIAKVLNHAEGGPRATMVYNRYAYDREKRIALETWDRCLTAILEHKDAAPSVVPFTPAASA
jgi:integrase